MTDPAPDFRALCAELVTAFKDESTYTQRIEILVRARTALATPPGPPKNCWLDDEPDLCPSPCVFDDPSEVISNCTYAQSIKCKTDCQYYRAATPPPEPPTPCITFCAPPLEEVIRIDKEGFHYKGQFIADAGEAHRLMLAFLKQHAKVEPEPPTDQEIEEWADAATEVPLEEMDPDVHGWRRCFTKEEFWASIRAALKRWAHG
jgi:hypothetical protein